MKLLLDKTAELFQTPDQWDNYLELIDLKDELIHNWHDETEKRILDFFMKSENNVEGWLFKENDTFCWFPDGCGDVIALSLEDLMNFGLYIDINKIDSEKAKELVKTEKYRKLCMHHRNDDNNNDWYIFQEFGNFHFDGAASNGSFGYERLLWYAYHQSNVYIGQLFEKLNQIRTEDNVLLFQEFYKEIKK